MKKKYKLRGENEPQIDLYQSNTDSGQSQKVSEAAIEYNYQSGVKIKGSPALTEEELNNALTTDQVIEAWCNYIDEKFNK